MFNCSAAIYKKEKSRRLQCHHTGLVIQGIVQESGRHHWSDRKPYTGSSLCAAVQLLDCKEPQTLKINGWSDTLKLIRAAVEWSGYLFLIIQCFLAITVLGMENIWWSHSCRKGRNVISSFVFIFEELFWSFIIFNLFVSLFYDISFILFLMHGVLLLNRHQDHHYHIHYPTKINH